MCEISLVCNERITTESHSAVLRSDAYNRMRAWVTNESFESFS